MDALLDAGMPVDHAPLGMPLIVEAVGNLRAPLVEYLISRGADPNRKWPSNRSARALALSRFENDPRSEATRRVLDVCVHGQAERTLAELDAKRRASTPRAHTLRAMQLAAADAARQGQTSVSTENMLIGVLRLANDAGAWTVAAIAVDMLELHAAIEPRLLPDADPLIGQQLPADSIAEAAVNGARAEAEKAYREQIDVRDLLLAILREREGAGAKLLAQFGGTEEKARRVFEGDFL